MSTWTPLDKNEALAQIGIGLHTGLRKGSDASEAPALWSAINDSFQAWGDALAYLMDGLEDMGLALCRKDDDQ